MRIRYNIADQKKINHAKFFLFAMVLLVLSLGLIMVGIYQLSATAKQFREERDKLQSYKDKIENINTRETQQTQEIGAIKLKWVRKQSFINTLIKDKMFPYIEKLDELEKLFPAGAFLKQINMNPKNNDLVKMTVTAVSFQKLLETYNVFLKYGLVIQNEAQSEPGSLSEASISIRLKNETKNK